VLRGSPTVIAEPLISVNALPVMVELTVSLP